MWVDMATIAKKNKGMKSETFQAKSYISMFSSATDRVYTNRNSTVFLYCPSDIDENRYRASKTMSDLFMTDNKYTIHAYGRKLYTNTADFVVCYETSPENTKFYMRDNVYVVNRVTEEYFDDDTVDKIYATKLNTNGTATAVEMYATKNDTQNKNGENCSFIENCPDLAGTEQRYRIEAGDIIAVLRVLQLPDKQIKKGCQYDIRKADNGLEHMEYVRREYK